jgi:hypothetical protein
MSRLKRPGPYPGSRPIRPRCHRVEGAGRIRVNCATSNASPGAPKWSEKDQSTHREATYPKGEPGSAATETLLLPVRPDVT